MVHASTLPHSLIIEKSVLGAFLLYEKIFLKYGHLVQPDFFYRSEYRKIYECMTVHGIRAPRLISEKMPDCSETVAALINEYDSAGDIDGEIKVLADKFQRRRLIEIATKTISEAQENFEDSAELITDSAVSAISEQQIGGGRPEHIRDILPAVMDGLQRKTTGDGGIQTGIGDVDRIFGSFEPKELTIIAARPSMGKTSFVLHIMRHCAMKKGFPILFFSLEMGKEQIAGRILFSESAASYSSALLGQRSALMAVGENIHRVADAGLYIDDTAGQTCSMIANKSEHFVKNYGVRAVFIDHVGFIRCHKPGRSKHEEVSEISKNLVALAKRLDIPVILVSQLSRFVEHRKPPIPMLSDLRESGSLEEDARKVLLLYREDYYRRDSEKKGQVDIIVAKNHNGETGIISVFGKKETMTFHDIEKTGEGDWHDR